MAVVLTFRLIEMSRLSDGFNAADAVHCSADRQEIGVESAIAASRFRILA